MDEEKIQALKDYVATANSGKYGNDWEALNSKFPELQTADPQALKDYVATANSGKYGNDWEALNSKFPELGFGQKESDTEPAKIDEPPKGAEAEASGDSVFPSASTESSSESSLVENVVDGEPEDSVGITLKDKEKAAKRIQAMYDKAGITDYTIDDEAISKEAARAKDTKRLKKIASDIDKINKSDNPKEQRSYLSNIGDNLMAGTFELYSMIASVPETVYDIFAIPQNLFVNLTGVGTEVSSAKFKEALDITNPILDNYVEETEKVREKITDFNTKYESTSIYENIQSGNYGDAFELLGSGIAQSAPISLSMMAGGAATSTAKLAGYGAVAFTGTNRLEVEKDNPELSELSKTFKSLGLAGAETVFAAVSMGSMGRVYKDIILKEGKEQGAIIFKQGLIKMYESALKKYGGLAGALGEGVEEVATTVTQNLINGRPIFENVEDSFIQGVGGGALYGAPINANNLRIKFKEGFEKRKVTKILESETNDYNYITDAFNPHGKITIDKVELVQQPKAYEMLEKELDESVKEGRISEDDSERHKKEFLETSLTVSKTNGINLTKEGRAEAVNLIQEKEKLKEEIKAMDDALAAPKKERVLAIDEKLKTLATEDRPKQKAVKEAEKLKEKATTVLPKFEEEGNRIAESTGGVFKSDVKSVKSIVSAKERYGLKKTEDVTDAARGTITVEKRDDFPQVAAKLREQGYKINEIKSSPDEDTGWRGLYAVKKINGVNTEIQVHTKETWEAQEKAHVYYEKWRDKKDKSSKGFQEDMAKSRELFDNAYGTKTIGRDVDNKEYSEQQEAFQKTSPFAWSVDEVTPQDVKKSQVTEHEGTYGLVTPDGDIKGVFKSDDTKKGTLKGLIPKLVARGGKKLDNFDGALTKMYEDNGFRVVSRTPFSEDMANEYLAPKGWSKEKHGTPDVVAMVYDPTGTANIEEKAFPSSEEGYNQMIEYRDKVLADMEANELGSELDDFMGAVQETTNLQLDADVTPKNKKAQLEQQAVKLMESVEAEGFTEEVFTGDNPAPQVEPMVIEITENTELASKVRRMGLEELIGKKVNLVMADQLKVGIVDVNGKKLERMGGHFFPLMDKVFGKVAWASISKSAASSIINGGIKSDYTIVYNMSPSAVDSNSAILETVIESIKALPKTVQQEVYQSIVEYLPTVSFNIVNSGNYTEAVHKVATESKSMSDFLNAFKKLPVDAKAAILKKILPSKGIKAGKKHSRLLEEHNIDIEDMRELNSEQFAKNLPSGAMTMVLEIQDKKGNKITKETKDEAFISPEQQKAEGLPEHPNYPWYTRGKAIAILKETVPFWNMYKSSMATINAKMAGIIPSPSQKDAISKEMRAASMSASKARTLSEKVTSHYEEFISMLQRAFPTVEMVTDEKAFNELASQLGAKKLATKNQKIYGAVYEGKLYLNPALANFNTPIHEFGHIWLNTAKNARPELYKKGMELVKGTEYETNVRESAEYKRVIKQMEKDGATQAEIDNYVAEEALAAAIGDKGESFVNAAQKRSFKTWLNDLYSFVRKLTGLSKMTPAQIENMTLEDFVQGVAVDILSGNEIFDKAQVATLGDALQLQTTGKSDVELLVEYSRGKGYSDKVIKQALSKRGFSAAAINEAMKPNPLLTTMPTNKQVTKLNAALAGKIKGLKKKSTNKKRAAKLPNTKLFTEAWDNALDLVADTVENTGNFAQSMYNGIESLRNSDWYRKLSTTGRAKAERMFREDINRQYEGDKVQNSWRDSMKASVSKMQTAAIQKIIDKYHIVRKTMRETFDISDDAVNFSQAEINMHGKAANDVDKFDKQMEGIMKEISDKGLEVQDVSDYMYAKHAKERNAYIKKNIDGENEFGSGMTPQEANKILNDTYSDYHIEALEELSAKFQEIITETRDIMLESGLITQEQYDALSEFYENYVPLQGFENEEVQGSNQIQGKKLDVAGHLLERSSGRSTRADNVIANIVSVRISTIIKARKNEVLQTLYELGTRNPNNGVFAVYTEETLPTTVKVDKTGKKVSQKEDARGREDYVGVKVDGEQYYMKFANAELGRVLNASNIEKTSIIGKVLRSMNRYLSQTLTSLNPEFVISNFSRDIQTAVVNVMAEADINPNFKGQNIAKDVVKDTPKAIKAIFQNERMSKTDSEYQKIYEEFKEDGAKTGWANQADIASIKKRMEAMVRHNNAKGLTVHNAAAKGKAILKFVNDVNTAVENGVRLAAYANARKAGLTREQAARMAKELTVNFNKSGEYGTVLNSMYLFFNAAVQGNVRFFKAMTTLKKTVQEDGSVKKSLNRGQQLALALTAFSGVLVLLNQGMSDEDEDGKLFYDKIPDFEKERNLIMINPFNGKDYYKIPLPYGYNIFHNFGTVVAEVSTGSREVGNGIGFLTSAAVGAFSPVSFGGGKSDVQNSLINAFTPTIAKPIVDLARNEDYFGSQIYNENFPMGTPKPDSSMGRRTTPEAFKQVTQFLNEITGGNVAESGKIDIAPESMYYMYKFAIGGTGKFLQNAGETVSTGIDIYKGQEKELEPRKIPFVRKVYGEPNKYADQATFFDNYDEVRQKLEAVKQKVASEEDMSNKGGIGATEGAYKEAAKMLKKIRGHKKAIEQNIIDPVKRTKKLNELDEKYYKIIRRANGVYNKRMKK